MKWWKGFIMSLMKIEITDFMAYQKGRGGGKESKKSCTGIYTFTNDVLPHLSVLQF